MAEKSAPFSAPKKTVISDFPEDEDELVLGKEEAEKAEPARPAPRVATGGGTLFERMSGLSRGTPKAAAEDEDDGGDIDIPRFLNRQSNQ